MFIPFVLKNANDFGHLFFIISIFFLLILGAPASAELPEKHRPALQLEYYLDSTHRLNMDRILQSQHHEDIDAEPIIWQKTKQTTLSLAQTQSTLWVKMTLFPQKISPHQKHYLVVHQSLIETLNLFYYGKNQKAFSFFAWFFCFIDLRAYFFGRHDFDSYGSMIDDESISKGIWGKDESNG